MYEYCQEMVRAGHELRRRNPKRLVYGVVGAAPLGKSFLIMCVAHRRTLLLVSSLLLVRAPYSGRQQFGIPHMTG
jgi:hypothetical protein